VQDSQSRESEKYGHESRGTRKQELLCTHGPEAICPTDQRTDYFFRELLVYNAEVTSTAVSLRGNCLMRYAYRCLVLVNRLMHHTVTIKM
jgi:hypothetical protein